ncbi:MAG TPA: SGNH/GDSL hydrolase family protein [Polyangiaceae bacterium]|mgnify:CR=1 FL=1|nr:MAG: hypothetical protein BWY17_04220 [Deltaproteobacteria bacterium ADurb.Bin207]HNS97857.1 SGNH/GDSL hydrolase family protein [Polyangiaceae bacterium]HNZ22816.1 SGNH/GDSL hydrolase family protein [Polyangiaceae bacterium]HOD24761.1 SGNH/GDSL hydrolase family protein [Polyangiaceae bacterium]HOE47714.1 SGNH/GDSL hydrolase family protein [Polyangiaceae bacterium]
MTPTDRCLDLVRPRASDYARCMSSFRFSLVAACLLGGLAAIALLPAAAASDSAPLAPNAPVVLHVGDSFVHVGFTQTLSPKFRNAGIRYVVRAKHSLYIPTLVNGVGLASLMRDHKPSLVILNIGANEMRMPQPSDHAPAIRQVSELVSREQTSCVWVTPPPPTDLGETGIVAEIKKNSSPCRVYDSTTIAPQLERERFDNVHPTRQAGARWAEAFWTWLQTERDPSSHGWRLKPRPPESPE